MLPGAKLTLPADVDNDGSTEIGVFDLTPNIEITPRIQTGKLISQAGSQASAAIDFVTGNESGRGGFSLDAGGGASVVEVSFRGFEGSSGQWGDGSGSDQADATGEEVFRQLSVLFRYLDVGTYDSRSPATLEWGEFASSGVYEPFDCTPQEPQLSFASEEQTSAFNGTITLVSTKSISDTVTPSDQQDTN